MENLDKKTSNLIPDDFLTDFKEKQNKIIDNKIDDN